MVTSLSSSHVRQHRLLPQPMTGAMCFLACASYCSFKTNELDTHFKFPELKTLQTPDPTHRESLLFLKTVVRGAKAIAYVVAFVCCLNTFFETRQAFEQNGASASRSFFGASLLTICCGAAISGSGFFLTHLLQRMHNQGQDIAHIKRMGGRGWPVARQRCCFRHIAFSFSCSIEEFIVTGVNTQLTSLRQPDSLVFAASLGAHVV